MVDILNVVDIQMPSEAVYSLVSTGEGIARWWTPNVVSEGDQVTIRFGTDWRILMKKVEDSPKRIRWRIVEHDSTEWPGTELIFRLSEADGWTTLEFDHAGWAEATSFFRFCSTKWATFLLSIKQAAEIGVGTPYPNEVKIGRND